MDAIAKVNRARQRDKEVLVRQKTKKLNQNTRLLPFRTFRLQKRLGESTNVNDVRDSMLATLPINATQSDVDDVARAISIMTQVGSVFVTAISVSPDN